MMPLAVAFDERNVAAVSQFPTRGELEDYLAKAGLTPPRTLGGPWTSDTHRVYIVGGLVPASEFIATVAGAEK